LRGRKIGWNFDSLMDQLEFSFQEDGVELMFRRFEIIPTSSKQVNLSKNPPHSNLLVNFLS
jgi:hypothetical protein